MKIFLKILLIILFLSSFLTISPSVLAEEIKSFNSQILAHQDGTMNVTETIIYDFGNASRHGIYRDIPKITTVGDLYRVEEAHQAAVMEVEGEGVIA